MRSSAIACLRVRGSVDDAAQAAKAHPVLRPHFGLSPRARSVNSAAPRDRSGYGPGNVLAGPAGAAGGGGTKVAGEGFGGVSIVGDGRASVGRPAD
eukprot:2608920-Pleurochrysis_carterae.AAC.1